MSWTILGITAAIILFLACVKVAKNIVVEVAEEHLFTRANDPDKEEFKGWR